MDFPGKNNWSGLPVPSPGDLPDPGMEFAFPESLALQADSLPLSHQESPLKETHTPKNNLLGISLVVQGLRLHAPNAGDQG